jgi:hypothetical protein
MRYCCEHQRQRRCKSRNQVVQHDEKDCMTCWKADCAMWHHTKVFMRSSLCCLEEYRTLNESSMHHNTSQSRARIWSCVFGMIIAPLTKPIGQPWDWSMNASLCSGPDLLLCWKNGLIFDFLPAHLVLILQLIQNLLWFLLCHWSLNPQSTIRSDGLIILRGIQWGFEHMLIPQ